MATIIVEIDTHDEDAIAAIRNAFEGVLSLLNDNYGVHYVM